jgi:hypothetical protein
MRIGQRAGGRWGRVGVVMAARPSRHVHVIFYSTFLLVESKVIPIMDRDGMVSNGEQERNMWKLDPRTLLFLEYTC